MPQRTRIHQIIRSPRIRSFIDPIPVRVSQPAEQKRGGLKPSTESPAASKAAAFFAAKTSRIIATRGLSRSISNNVGVIWTSGTWSDCRTGAVDESQLVIPSVSEKRTAISRLFPLVTPGKRSRFPRHRPQRPSPPRPSLRRCRRSRHPRPRNPLPHRCPAVPNP